MGYKLRSQTNPDMEARRTVWLHRCRKTHRQAGRLPEARAPVGVDLQAMENNKKGNTNKQKGELLHRPTNEEQNHAHEGRME